MQFQRKQNVLLFKTTSLVKQFLRYSLVSFFCRSKNPIDGHSKLLEVVTVAIKTKTKGKCTDNPIPIFLI